LTAATADNKEDYFLAHRHFPLEDWYFDKELGDTMLAIEV